MPIAACPGLETGLSEALCIASEETRGRLTCMVLARLPPWARPIVLEESGNVEEEDDDGDEEDDDDEMHRRKKMISLKVQAPSNRGLKDGGVQYDGARAKRKAETVVEREVGAEGEKEEDVGDSDDKSGGKSWQNEKDEDSLKGEFFKLLLL